MKRVRINEGKVGIVSYRGDYKGVVSSGKYWFRPTKRISILDKAFIYKADARFALMYRDESFSTQVSLLEVGDGEIALQFVNGKFEAVITTGTCYYWRDLVEFSFIKIDLNSGEVDESIPVSVLRLSELTAYIRPVEVSNHQEALLLIDGKLTRKLREGSYFFWRGSSTIEVLKADMRQLQMDLSGQELLTKDKAALRVNFSVQYKVNDIEKALLGTKDFEKQLYILMQLALREYIGTQFLDELLDNKEKVAQYVFTSLKQKVEGLGVDIIDCGLKDIILPGEVKEIMNQVLIAQKQAQANTIARREETASTRSLLNTAKLMEENTTLYKLKEMEYIERISDRIGEVTVSGGNQLVDQLKQIFTK